MTEPKTITPGSTSHRVLEILATHGMLSTEDIKRLGKFGDRKVALGAIIRHMLVGPGYVIQIKAEHFEITASGLELKVVLSSTPRTPKLRRNLKVQQADLFKRANYEPLELKQTITRAGAYDAFHLPSRMGDRLHYRDGSVVRISEGVMEVSA